jgi:hypothetical protein
MRVQTALLCMPLSLLGACVAGDDDPTADVVQSATPVPPPPGPPPCTPAPEIDPLQCNPEEPAPPPPPINGRCTIDIEWSEVGFFTGQGWLEGRAEAVTYVTATDVDTGAVTDARYPAAGTIKMDVDKTQLTGNLSLGTYVVEEGEHKDILVCATFIEDDPIDADDSGNDCETIELSCPQAADGASLAANLCKGGDCTKLRGRMTAEIEVLTADADRDCKENEDDWTPDVCDEAWKGQLCRASLVHFAYEDGLIKDLAQFIGTDLTLAMTGYDRVILLIDDDDYGPYKINAAAQALADVVMLPSEENFFTALQDLTADHCSIDLWNFTHGSIHWGDFTPGTTAFVEQGWITTGEDDEHIDDSDKTPDIEVSELIDATELESSGTDSVPILMNYSTACFGREWNQAWVDVGAKVTSGSADINFKPTNYPNFAAAWNANQTYGVALAGEATVAAENLAFNFIAGIAALPPSNCVPAISVLQQNNCAFNYFTDIDKSGVFDANGDLPDGPDKVHYWIGGPLYDIAGIAYDSTTTGAVNMRRSSVKTLAGNPNIRKSSVPTW